MIAKTKLVLYSNTLKSVIELILRSWFVNSRLGFWVIILKNGYMVHLSVFGQPWLAPQQQLEKKWSGARANGGLKREKANRPITTNCRWKKEESVLYHKHATEGGCFFLKRTRVIPFSRDLLHFVRLRSQPYTSSVTISGRTPHPRSHGPSSPFHVPERVGRVEILTLGTNCSYSKGKVALSSF